MLPKRPTPIIRVTSLAKLLSQDHQCVYPYWLKANYQLPRVVGEVDQRLVLWNMRHTELLLQRSDELRDVGWRVTSEGRNFFSVDVDGAIVSGQPDLVASRLDGDHQTVRLEDVKAGQPRNADSWQMRLYLHYFPMARKLAEEAQVRGFLAYSGGTVVEIPGIKCDSFLEEQIQRMIAILSSSVEPERAPNRWQCQYCTVEDCEKNYEGQK
jgi:hypothetical protein